MEWLPTEDSQLQARAIEGEENTRLFNFVKDISKKEEVVVVLVVEVEDQR